MPLNEREQWCLVCDAPLWFAEQSGNVGVYHCEEHGEFHLGPDGVLTRVGDWAIIKYPAQPPPTPQRPIRSACYQPR
jgi:hypothetical protein